MLRRVAVGLSLGCVLVLVTATGAAGLWSVRQPLASTAQSGDLNLTVQWEDGASWGMISPGTTIDQRALITVTGSGTTLRATLAGTALNNTAFDAHVTRSISVDDCTGTAGVALADDPSNIAGLVPGDQLTVCVRYTLAATAPATLQKVDLQPHVIFDLTQVGAP